MPASLTAVARHLLFVREATGPNRGAWVEFFQRFSGGVPGDSWCADFVSFVLDVAYHGKAPIVKTGSTQVMLSHARAAGWVVDTPQIDDLYFFVHPDGTPHHVGIVTLVGAPGQTAVLGIAGNTSEDGTSSNGTGVFEHRIVVANVVFVRLPVGA